jgi:hypothetical protein
MNNKNCMVVDFSKNKKLRAAWTVRAAWTELRTNWETEALIQNSTL